MAALRWIAVGVGYIPADFIASPPAGWSVRTAPHAALGERRLPQGALALSLVRQDVPFPVILIEDPAMEPQVAHAADNGVAFGMEALTGALDSFPMVRHLVRQIREQGRLD